MTAIEPVRPGAVATVDAVLDLCERGRSALVEARTLSDGQHILAYAETLTTAVRAQKLAEEAGLAASALRIDAERRVGQLIREEREQGTLARQEDGRRRLRPVESMKVLHAFSPPATLADHGIEPHKAAEMSRLADTADETYEAAKKRVVERAKGSGLGVSRSAVLREINPEREKRSDERWLEANRFTDACERIVKLGDAALIAIRFDIYPGDLPLVGDAVRRNVNEALAVLTKIAKELER